MKLEEEFVNYVSNPSRTEPLKLPSWDSYHRMLAHRFVGGEGGPDNCYYVVLFVGGEGGPDNCYYCPVCGGRGRSG